MPILGIGSRMNRRAIVGINHVTGGAATGAVISRMIVRPEEIQGRVKQARALKTDKNRISTIFRTQAARAEPRTWLAGNFLAFGDAGSRPKATTAFEDAEEIAGLSYFEAWQRVQVRKHAFAAHLIFGGRRPGL